MKIGIIGLGVVRNAIKNGFERSFLNAEDLNNMNNILKNYKLKVEPSTCKLILAFTILEKK